MSPRSQATAREPFEEMLDAVARQLGGEARQTPFTASKEFENRARQVIADQWKGHDIDVDFAPHPHIFPDIALGEFGIEVKFTANDTWRSVANSVFESTRAPDVRHIYVLFGKMGGEPDVRWGRYDECVMHVRTSHVPRFEVELYPEQSLFEKMGTTYAEFSQAPFHEKMRYIREYARGRLKPGERLWWLEDQPEELHSLPLEVRLYTRLPQEDKRRLRAEAAMLCPQVVKPSRAKRKYDDAVMYVLTYHGVLCPQARDLFSAGSVAMRADQTRGGNYVERALKDIEVEMIEAAARLDDALFVEYWGESVPPEQRIGRWLAKADSLAKGWTPSASLFQGRTRRA
jgi:hypothetical protein